MLSRDGITVHANPDAFGKEWQVKHDEPKLFHTSEGAIQHPAQCKMPSVDAMAGRKLRRRLGEALVSQKDAEAACEHAAADEFDACVFDVLATNNKDLAGVY